MVPLPAIVQDALDAVLEERCRRVSQRTPIEPEVLELAQKAERGRYDRDEGAGRVEQLEPAQLVADPRRESLGEKGKAGRERWGYGPGRYGPPAANAHLELVLRNVQRCERGSALGERAVEDEELVLPHEQALEGRALRQVADFNEGVIVGLEGHEGRRKPRQGRQGAERDVQEDQSLQAAQAVHGGREDGRLGLVDIVLVHRLGEGGWG